MKKRVHKVNMTSRREKSKVHSFPRLFESDHSDSIWRCKKNLSVFLWVQQGSPHLKIERFSLLFFLPFVNLYFILRPQQTDLVWVTSFKESSSALKIVITALTFFVWSQIFIKAVFLRLIFMFCHVLKSNFVPIYNYFKNKSGRKCFWPFWTLPGFLRVWTFGLIQ